jgi:hypothetical protein
MKYIIWCFAIGSGLIALTILGETVAERLPKTHWFSKWWRGNVVGKDPSNPNL